MSSGHPGLINDFIEKGSSFKWNTESLLEIETIKSKYPEERIQSAVMPLLFLAQKQNDNWLSSECIDTVSQTLNMPKIRVAEVATFYSMFNLKPVGKNLIQICRTSPCWLRGSNKITKTICSETNCDINHTSEDGLFTVVEVECLGACSNGPMIQINDEFYEDLDDKNTKKIIDNIKNHKPNKVGSQTGRLSSENAK
ncbi:NAD(P)H-dependent oxidoreductase subunit E [Alphaproteobacteria bacterium]|jgi:NADH-quinone oxidoreductase subunit E|nr:NAD(P)H-dependent oxidoreductase subunit E [Alphaproteobacteria bacterium]